MRVTHMHGSRVSAVRMSSSLCHLTFSLLMFHPSLLLLFLDGRFETFPDLDDLTDVRMRTRSLATWPIPRTPHKKVGAKNKTLKEGVEVAKSVVHPLSESQWNRGHFSMRKWESEKHKSWGMPAEGFKGHVATDGSLLGAAGKWRACGWAEVQLDYDEEMGPLHGM